MISSRPWTACSTTYHGELAQLLLDQIAFLDAKIAQLSARAAELTAAMPAAWGVDADGTTGPGAGAGADAPVLNAVARLAQIPGLSPDLARSIKKARATPGCAGPSGQAAIGAARTATFLGERYHRIARRRGKAKGQVAVARSILVIICHLLSNPEARFTDLGCGYYQARTDTGRKLRNHIRQI